MIRAERLPACLRTTGDWEGESDLGGNVNGIGLPLVHGLLGGHCGGDRGGGRLEYVLTVPFITWNARLRRERFLWSL